MWAQVVCWPGIVGNTPGQEEPSNKPEMQRVVGLIQMQGGPQRSSGPAWQQQFALRHDRPN